MGMSASQARLLSITARLSNNELEQQSLAYSKQRLAESSSQINDTYLEALSKTKYQVLTGYNNAQANYADLTYAQLMGVNSIANGKQYLVKNKDGRVLVSEQIAKAFKDNNGDFNRMLRDLGYTQANIDVSQIAASKEAIHQAWDKYLVSVGKSLDNFVDGEHIFGFGYTPFGNTHFSGYPTYDTAYAIPLDENDERKEGVKVELLKDDQGYYTERLAIKNMLDNDGNTIVYYQTADDQINNEYHELTNVIYNPETKLYTYNEGEYASLYIDQYDGSISDNIKNRFSTDVYPGPEGYYGSEGLDENRNGRNFKFEIEEQTKALNYDGTTKSQRELYDYAVALSEAFYNRHNVSNQPELKYDAQMVAYYRNIFNEMATHGFTTLNESFRDKLITTRTDSDMTSEAKIFNDSDWFVRQLKAGNLTLAYYSIAEKGFLSTGLDSDESIVEKEDTAAMAIAEQLYKTQMDKIEHQDKQFDLELNKLESEHNALQTEYDAVKKVISGNVEKSFNTFS